MSLFRVNLVATSIKDQQRSTPPVQVLVDSGSELSWLPADILQAIGITARPLSDFPTATGQTVQRPVGYAILRAEGFETIDEVVFAEPGDVVTLGRAHARRVRRDGGLHRASFRGDDDDHGVARAVRDQVDIRQPNARMICGCSASELRIALLNTWVPRLRPVAAIYHHAHISAFRGIRYDLGHVGSLSNVIAPPYDVIDAELQQRLYDMHPANVVRLILNKDEPGDDEHDNRYTRAARLLRSWLRDGVLFTEADPAIYVYHQVFTRRRRRRTRGAASCAACGSSGSAKGNIYPHEETHGAAKADRLKLWSACKANLSQIFGLYPDAENEAQNILEAAIAGVAPLEATDHLGVVHRIWPVTDVRTITAVIGAMGDRPVYIADGHHRYETACNLRDQISGRAGSARRNAVRPSTRPTTC